MRVTSLAWWVAALCTSTTLAAPPSQEKGAAVLAEEAVHGETPADDGTSGDYTIFDGLKVPPMIEIEGDKFAETVKDGYWYVKVSC